jgi:hypothetical protein
LANFASLCLVDNLAATVNLKSLNPLSNQTYQLPDIVTIMNDPLSLIAVPSLKAVAQNYFVMNVDVPIVSGKSAYTFPARAIGNAVRDVVLVDASGNEVSLNNLEREYIKVQFPFTFMPAIWAFGMYATANEINLWNTLVQTYTAYTLRFITERRPGALTLSTNCGQITNITGNVLTLSYVDPSWTTSTTFDIINQLPPFQSFGDDIAVSLISGFQITVSGTLPTSVVNGAWVAPAMLSPIPQIPYELFPILTDYATGIIAAGLDQSQLLAAVNARVQTYVENALKLAKPRVSGSPKIIINRDSNTGFGRGFGMGGFR